MYNVNTLVPLSSPPAPFRTKISIVIYFTFICPTWLSFEHAGNHILEYYTVPEKNFLNKRYKTCDGDNIFFCSSCEVFQLHVPIPFK